MKRKIENVFFEPSVAARDGDVVCMGSTFALCDDGTLWRLGEDSWEALPEIPQDEKEQEVTEHLPQEFFGTKKPETLVDCKDCNHHQLGLQYLFCSLQNRYPNGIEQIECNDFEPGQYYKAPEYPVANVGIAEFEDGTWYSIVSNGSEGKPCADCGVMIPGLGNVEGIKMICRVCAERAQEEKYKREGTK